MGGNQALDLNPPTADYHLSTNGSDWLWAAFSVFGTSLLAMVGLSFLVSIFNSYRARQRLIMLCRGREVPGFSTNLPSSSSPPLPSPTSPWRLTSVQPLLTSNSVVRALVRSGYVLFCPH